MVCPVGGQRHPGDLRCRDRRFERENGHLPTQCGRLAAGGERARSNRDGTWNVGTGVSTSILELLHALEREIEPATEIRHGPRRPGDVNNSRLEIDSIENDLGWRPKYYLAGGIADMIRKANADR